VNNLQNSYYIACINSAIDYIEGNISQPLKLESIARAAGLSPFHFHRIFSSFMNESLNNFVRRVRIEKVAMMLFTNPGYSITKIAYMNGFSSSQALAKQFRLFFNTTPGQYRKSKIGNRYSKNRSGVCIISSKKKKPFISDKKFMQKFGFEVADTIGQDYELLALSFDGTKPAFGKNVKKLQIESQDLTICYSVQCPYIPDCIEQISNYCKACGIPLQLIKINSCEEAKKLPCIFNNWAVFDKGKFVTHHLLNEGYLKKTLGL